LSVRLLSAYVCGVVAVVLIAVGVVVMDKPASATPPSPTATGSVPGSYNALAPARVLDTRSGLAAVAPSGQITVPVLGRGGVPSTNVSAIALTITAVGSTAAGGVTAWADDGTTTKPGTSNLSYAKGVTTSNLAVVKVGAGGKIRLSNNSVGSVQLVGDVAGYYVGGAASAPGTTVATTPARAFDTRSGGLHAIAAGKTLTVPIGGHAGVPSSGASAALITITALTPAHSGTVRVWPAGQAQPATTNITMAAGRTVADLVTAQLGTGAITILNNSTGSLNLVGDVTGYVLSGGRTAGGTMSTVPPKRSVDTRSGLGARRGKLGAGASLAIALTDRVGIPATNVAAIAMTVTAVAPASTGGVTTWADGYEQPGTRSMSYVAGQNTSVLVIAPVGPDGRVAFYNWSSGSTDLVVDVLGYFRADKVPIVASTSHYVRNLTGGSSDALTMQNEGCADAHATASGVQHLVLLHIGAQNLFGSTWRVVLSATSTVLTDAQLVTALNGYVDGYVACRTSTDPITVAIGTNNDGIASSRGSAAGTEWAENVVDAVGTHAAGAPGVVIAGANDIESDFAGLESEAEDWTRAYLAATSAPYVFTGAATGCSTTGVGELCKWDWTQRNYYDLAHGISPSRILALPQIYFSVNAAQWKYISLAGASGADRVTFVGALDEYAACHTPGSGCNDLDTMLTPAASWQALRDQLSSNAAVNLQRLPVSTDLRTDTAPGAPLSANRVTTAGVR
jgi:hypothetical protein